MPLMRWPQCAGGATVCFDFAFRCLCCCGLWRRALVSGVGKMETVFCACCGVCAVCCCCCILRWLWDRGVVYVWCVVVVVASYDGCGTEEWCLCGVLLLLLHLTMVVGQRSGVCAVCCCCCCILRWLWDRGVVSVQCVVVVASYDGCGTEEWCLCGVLLLLLHLTMVVGQRSGVCVVCCCCCILRWWWDRGVVSVRCVVVVVASYDGCGTEEWCLCGVLLLLLHLTMVVGQRSGVCVVCCCCCILRWWWDRGVVSVRCVVVVVASYDGCGTEEWCLCSVLLLLHLTMVVGQRSGVCELCCCCCILRWWWDRGVVSVRCVVVVVASYDGCGTEEWCLCGVLLLLHATPNLPPPPLTLP